MEPTPSCTAGSRTREIALARCRGRSCSGMLVVPALAALCLAFPGFARAVVAQRSATIHVTATVTNAYTAASIRAASAPAAAVEPARHLQRLPVAGVGVLEVEGAAGAQVRLVSIDAGDTTPLDPWRPGAGPLAAAGDTAWTRPAQLVRATVSYPGL